MRAAIAAARFAVNPHAVAELKAPDDFRRDENILRRLNEVAFGVAQKAEAFAGNLDDAFAELRFAGRLLAVWAAALGTVALLSRSRIFIGRIRRVHKSPGVLTPAFDFTGGIVFENFGATWPRVSTGVIERAGRAFRIIAAPGTAARRTAPPERGARGLGRLFFHFFAHN